MSTASPTVDEVKRANRRLYDAVADRYEAVDGRRGATLVAWIRSRLEQLAAAHGRERLLDLGSGTGVVTRAARGVYEQTIAIDLSPKILAAGGAVADQRIAADTDSLPMADESVDLVTCFAVLHHLQNAESLVGEVARVLRPGGAFWSDHDMELAFYKRFRWPLAAYRRLRAADRKYMREAPDIDAATYALAECHENGVDSRQVLRWMGDARLEPRASFHWFGLTPLTDRLFGQRDRSRGWGPLLSIVAVKPREGWGNRPGR